MTKNFSEVVDDLFENVDAALQATGKAVGKIAADVVITTNDDVKITGKDVVVHGNLTGKTIDEIKKRQDHLENWMSDIAQVVNQIDKRLKELENPQNVKLS